MVQPFRVTDGDDPGADKGGWDDAGNVDLPGVLTVGRVRGTGQLPPELTTTTFEGQVEFEGGVSQEEVGTYAGVRLPQGEFTPQDHGFESWTHDPYYPASSVIAVNGRVYVVKLVLRRPIALASLWWSVGTAGATPTAGQNQVGIYDPDGDLLNSAVVDGQISSSGAKETALAANLSTPFVWAAFLFNASTAPTLARGSSFETTPNMNLATAGLRAAVVASAQTSLPSSFSPGTLTTNGSLTFFAGLEAA